MPKPVLSAVLALFAWSAPTVAAESQPQGVPAAGEAAAAPPAPDKNSGEPSKVYIGAGIGPGLDARFRVNGNTVTFSDQFQGATDKSPLVAVNVASFGLALNSKTLVGIDLSAVAQLGTIAGNATHVQISNYFAALTYFPWEKGLFVRGGGGISNLVTVSGSQSDRVLRVRRPARSGLRLAGERQAPSDADLHSDLAVLLVEREQARQLAVRRRLPGIHVPELRRAEVSKLVVWATSPTRKTRGVPAD